jgi:tRNA pseudouridine38-40 synthase
MVQVELIQGVHAIEQSGHFDSKNEILDLTKFLKSINHFLNDKGVAIKKIRKRAINFIQDFLQNKEFINI